MTTRKLANFEVSSVGIGCMGFSHGYGALPPEEESIRLMRKAFDMGYTLFDTAEVYGPFVNETLVGKAVQPFRDKIFLTTKFTPCRVGDQDIADAQGVVDVHSHILPNTYIENLASHGALMYEGFPLPKWNAEAQLKWMDEAGVETAVLTLAAPQPMFGSKAENAAQIRKLNETAAKLKVEHPGRFLFCAALPLPDVDAALAELDYAFDTLHADGVKLATNACGQYLGDPALDPLFAALDRRKAVVILHPHRLEPVAKDVMRQTPLAMQEYLSETTRAVSRHDSARERQRAF